MKLTAGLRILVIEDDLDTRNLIKAILAKEGFKNILSCRDGVEGMGQMRNSLSNHCPIDLVLADWNMPNLDGMSLLGVLKGSHEFSSVPFIMVTADNEQSHVLEAINAGVSSYVIKPVTPKKLRDKIVRVVKRVS